MFSCSLRNWSHRHGCYVLNFITPNDIQQRSMLGSGFTFDIVEVDVRVFQNDAANKAEGSNRSLNRVPPLGFESIVFVFAMIKFRESIQDGSSLIPVLFKFMTDSIWAFALPLSEYNPYILCFSAYMWWIPIVVLTANAVLSTLSGPISLAASVYVDMQGSITSSTDCDPQVDACSSWILCKHPDPKRSPF